MYMYFHCFANTARLLRAYFSKITATDRLHYKTIKYKKTHQFRAPCKSDQVTHPKQHKSFFWDNVIARSHCTCNVSAMALILLGFTMP